MIIPAVLIWVTVQAGQTMSGIASAHGASLAAVEQANPNVNPNVISVGERIAVPEQPGPGTYKLTCTMTVASDGSQSVSACSASPLPNGSDKRGAGVAPNNSSPAPQQPTPATGETSGYVPMPVGNPVMWACIERAESGDNPRAVNSIPGYIGNGGGLFGDLRSTWADYGGYPEPFDAPVSVQVAFNAQLYERYGYQPWDDPCTGRNGGG